MDLFELKAWMGRVTLEPLICGARSALNWERKIFKRPTEALCCMRRHFFFTSKSQFSILEHHLASLRAGNEPGYGSAARR